ncbi:Platelet glycoprotein V [Labeo rohita]|uniref:Platelet glycoprotein V n=1 Tax=Labeo rohita TaxID=84645 RepID=A0ABQ8L0Z4_LABRO|nr:Platelet glycoprotein V [Labeo rohita]
MNGSCWGAVRPLANGPPRSFQRSTRNSPGHGAPPTRRACILRLPPPFGDKDKGYEKLPPLEETVAAHLCPPTAIGWKAKASHPSKPSRTTSALARNAYASAGQAHSMAVLQIFLAKLLAATDKSALDSATLTELRSTTDLVLRSTKATAQAIGRSMASLVVLVRHLWLTLTEVKDTDKVPFLDALVSPTGLFGPVVEGFAKRFSAAQKTSKAISAAASGRPKSVPPQQPVKPAPDTAAASAQPAKPQPRQRSHSAKCYPFPKRQGPWPRLVLDPAPPPSPWSKGQEEEGAKSCDCRTNPQEASVMSPSTPHGS